MASKRISKRKLQSGDLAFAHRANCREEDLQRLQINKINVMRRKSISKIDDEIEEVRKDLREIQRYVPHTGLIMTRPHTSIGGRRRMSSTSTTTSHCQRHNSHTKVRPRTTETAVIRTHRQQHALSCDVTRYDQQGIAVIPDSASSSLLQVTSQSHIEGRVLRRQSSVRAMSKEHIRQKKISEESLNRRLSLPYEIATRREMDKIIYVNKWLSIKNVYSARTLPPEAKKYTEDANWTFDMQAFLEKYFPAETKEDVVKVSKAQMEKEKSNFQSFTAATALLKFKSRLAKYRAKSLEERKTEKLWEELKQVRYLRLRGPPPPDPTISSVFR